MNRASSLLQYCCTYTYNLYILYKTDYSCLRPVMSFFKYEKLFTVAYKTIF